MNPSSMLPAWLILSTLHGSGAILLVGLLRTPVRRWLGAQAAHLLWLLVLVQMAAPWLPRTPLGWRPQFVAAPAEAAPAGTATTRVTVSVADTPMADRAPRVPAEPTPAFAWPARLWAFGGGAVLLLALLRALRAARLVRRAREVTVAELGEALREGDWGGMQWRIRETSELRSPALCGLWRPVVLLPVGWRAQFTAAELRCIFAHELGHIRRGDLWWRWAFLLASAVHWFNPLVWLAARLAQRDQEMACDEWVITRRGLAEVEPYGEALLKAVRLLGRPGFTSPVQAGMAESKAGLAARLRRLTQIRVPVRGGTAMILGFTILLCAWSSPGPQATAAAPDEAPPPHPESSEPTAAAPPPFAPPPATTTSRPAPVKQVEIESKFVEISGKSETINARMAEFFPAVSSPLDAQEEAPGTLKVLNDPSGYPAVLAEAQFQELLERLNKVKGLDLLSAPRVTTRAGQRAVIEIIREFRYPTAFEPPTISGKNSAPVTPKKFETRNTGVTLEVLPEIVSDGTVDLTLTPSVVEFVGFINYGAGRPARTAGRDALEQMMRSRSVAKTEQVINQPVFATRRITTSGNLRSGQTLLLGGITREDTQIVEDGPPGRRQQRTEKIQRLLFVFVTARLVDRPTGVPAQRSAGASPAPVAATPTPAPSGTPYAVPVPNKPGFFTSPFAPKKGYIDLRGFPSGAEVKCPYSGKMLLVP